MKRYIDYNVSDGSINCIRIIQESNYALYNTTSLLEIDKELEIDVRNSYISGGEIIQKPDINIETLNFTYPISSADYFILSSIPVDTSFIIHKQDITDDAIEFGNVTDGALEINFDTEGIYEIILDNELYNNLTSTYLITAY